MEISVILVEPKFTGNVGAVARIMKNFGFQDLYIIGTPEIDEEAEKRAMHAMDILNRAIITDDLRETIKPFDMVVGTSGVETSKEKKFIRQAETPKDFAADMQTYKGDTALLFGREDIGMSNEELRLCDRLVKIPSSEDYPILNLSHAVGIMLYELYKFEGVKEEEENAKPVRPEITESERERVINYISNILKSIDYPEHKEDRTMIMLRRMLGRANTSRWEYHRLMGILSKIKERLEE